MRALSASELLNAWERAFGQSAIRRGLTLLEAACDDASSEQLAQLSIGQRDARLLTLREWTFGSNLTSLTSCPACGERLEVSFMASDLFTSVPSEVTGELALAADGYEVRFRLPNSRDLIATSEEKETSAARAVLIERCVFSIRRDGRETGHPSLPQSVVDAISAKMADADPQALVQLAMRCPDCSNEWQAQFDIGSFFWAEINAWATRVLNEVHVLASAYGWREADILHMSAWRRQCYLNLVSG